MENDEKYIELVETLKAEAKDYESIIRSLRENGARQMQSVKAIKKVFGLSLREADNLVVNSETWKDILTSTINLRDTFADVLDSFSSDEEE